MRQVFQPSVQPGPGSNARSVSLLNRFQPLQLIGQSPHAKVHTARDLETGATVVMKVLDSQACKGYDRERMLNETKYHSMVRHPNVVALHQHFEVDRHIYLIIEHAENGDLYHFLKKRSKELTEADRRKLMLQVCSAVAAVHAAGLIHRDIKPENVFVDRQLNAKLGDFGWCCLAADEIAIREMAGTLEYMPPECLRKQRQTPRSDVWSLGIFVYELYHNREPFKGKSKEELLQAIYQSNCIFAPDVPNEVVELFELCVRYDQAQRPCVTDLLKARYFDFTKPNSLHSRLLEVPHQSNILKPASQNFLNRIVSNSNSIPITLASQATFANVSFAPATTTQVQALFESPRKEVVLHSSFCLDKPPEDPASARTAGQRIYYQTQSSLRSNSTGDIREAAAMPKSPPPPVQHQTVFRAEQLRKQEPPAAFDNYIPKSYPKFNSHSLNAVTAPVAAGSFQHPAKEQKPTFRPNQPSHTQTQNTPTPHNNPFTKTASSAVFAFVPGQDEQIRAKLASKYLLPNYSYYLSSQLSLNPRDRFETSRPTASNSQIENSLPISSTVLSKPALKLKLTPKAFKSDFKPRTSVMKVYEDYRSGKSSLSQISRDPNPPSRPAPSNSNSEHEISSLIQQLQDPKNQPIYLKYLSSNQPSDPDPSLDRTDKDPKPSVSDRHHLHTQETTVCDEPETQTATLDLAKRVSESLTQNPPPNKKPPPHPEAKLLPAHPHPNDASHNRDSKRPSLTLRPKGSSNNHSFVSSDLPAHHAQQDLAFSKSLSDHQPQKKLLLRANSKVLDRSLRESSAEHH